MSAALAADANIRIKTMADFILSHSQAQENERKKKAQKLNKLHSSTQTRAGAMKIPRIDSKYTRIACSGKRRTTAGQRAREGNLFVKNEERAKQR